MDYRIFKKQAYRGTGSQKDSRLGVTDSIHGGLTALKMRKKWSHWTEYEGFGYTDRSNSGPATREVDDRDTEQNGWRRAGEVCAFADGIFTRGRCANSTL